VSPVGAMLVAALAATAPAELIVKLQPGVTAQSVGSPDEEWQSLVPRLAARKLQARSELERIYVVRFRDGRSCEQGLRELAARRDVAYASPNHLLPVSSMPDDSLFQEGLQWGLERVGGPDAWDTVRGDSTVLVAIVDTGVDYTHPDLSGNVWRNLAETPDNGLDDDGNGYIDDDVGWDFTDAPEMGGSGDYLERDNDPLDDHGHGTYVAGIACATADNRIGVAGIAPGCRVMPLRAGFCAGPTAYLQEDDVSSAIVYAADNGARVINMSWGDVVVSPVIRDVLRYADALNCVLVASSGNSQSDQPHYPSGYAEAIAVGGTNPEDGLYFSSNYGVSLEVTAPAVDVWSTWTSLGTGGEVYRSGSGTSAAAPFVSGLAALMISRNPGLTNDEVRQILAATAQDLGEPGWDPYFGSGRIRAPAAVEVGEAVVVTIVSPAAQEGIPGVVPLVGTVAGAKLQSFSAWWGAGTAPAQWYVLGEWENRQVVSDTIAWWHPSGLEEGSYALRVTAEDLDGQSYEQRVGVVVDFTAPEIAPPSPTLLLKDDHWGCLVEWESDDVTTSVLRAASMGCTLEVPTPYVTTNHRVILEAPAWQGPWSYTVACRNAAGLETTSDSLGHWYRLSVPEERFGAGTLVPDGEPEWPQPAQYICPDVMTGVPFGGGLVFVVTEYVPAGSDRALGALELLAPDGEGLTIEDGPVLPRAVGDTDGDGLLEIVCSGLWEGKLWEQDSADALPTTNIWASFPGNSCHPDGVADLDGDGVAEILAIDQAYRGTIVIVRHLGNDSYEVADSLPNPSSGLDGVSLGSVVAADFDGDGAAEIVVGDHDGDLYAYTGTPGAFSLLWQGTSSLVTIGGLAAGDYDGDGLPEVAVASSTDPSAYNTEHELDARRWTVEVLDLDAGEFATAAQVVVAGWADEGNAVGSADLDEDGRDEILLSANPNLYVLSMDGEGSLTVKSHLRGAASEGFAAYHMDRDGFVELLYSGWESSYLMQYEKPYGAPPPPSWVNAVPVDSSRVELTWAVVPEATWYRVYRGEEPGQLALVDSLAPAPSWIDAGLESFVTYWYAVAAVDPTAEPSTSTMSTAVSAIPSPPPRLVLAAYHQAHQIALDFSQPLDNGLAKDPTNYTADGRVPSSSVVVRQGRRVVLSFAELPYAQPCTVSVSTVVRSQWGVPIDPCHRTAVLEIPEDLPVLYVESAAYVGGQDGVAILFNESLAESGALDPARYRVEPDLTVDTVRWGDTGHTEVMISFAEGSLPQADGTLYTIIVSGVRGVSGAVLEEGLGDRASFTGWAMSLGRVRPCPNPVSASSGEVRFLYLTPTASIRIHNVVGERVASLEVQEARGWAAWPLRTDGGRRVKPGLYVWTIRSGRDSARGRLVVLP
jgi:subtilisin family serine protease